jgi:hypothetical protein
MTKSKEWNRGFNFGYFAMAIHAIVFIALYIMFVNSPLQHKYDKVLNDLAPYKCQSKTYETTSISNTELANCYNKLCPNLILRMYGLSDEDCRELCTRASTHTTYKSFTTGRYIDGKIECQAEPIEIERSLHDKFVCASSCPLYHPEDVCWANCDQNKTLYWSKSQDFTLEEVGI